MHFPSGAASSSYTFTAEPAEIKGDDDFVACSDCSSCADETLKFVRLGSHDEAYSI